ncbi:proline dehydrogenase [Deferribacter autotrophicus]|uniref:proline dehydrogenase n=1 Tax=Deferribacter autotrophicus TaxID=500465 RepID=A0A5A8F8Y6_9BACT|nr:proline dehydrogenase family protein [Deferribacter autotrophicus]KAA0259217.1 proline dehydrogenase [Deferribacter autotrophicus]
MGLLNFLISKSIMYIPGPIVGLFAKSYIAGPNLYDAVKVTHEMNNKNMMATIDILGEFISTKDEAKYFKERCIEILDTIDKEGLDANLSLKPTQMGLLLDKQFAFDNIREIVAHAKSLNNFVRIDMEDSPCTDDTLEFYRKLREEFPGHVGTVLQAYLRRTPDDIEKLSDGPLNFRLCKGIYNEPRKIAYKDPYIINRNYTYCLEKLFQKRAYVGIATHDEKLVFEALRLIEKYDYKKDEYEFQMLLGVDEELREIIVSAGHRLRVYVPFGKDWLPYSRRRLKENPNIGRHALRQLLGLHGN